jgi:hypothetical protein
MCSRHRTAAALARRSEPMSSTSPYPAPAGRTDVQQRLQLAQLGRAELALGIGITGNGTMVLPSLGFGRTSDVVFPKRRGPGRLRNRRSPPIRCPRRCVKRGRGAAARIEVAIPRDTRRPET